MSDDIGAFRKIVLPSPRLFARLLEEQQERRAREIEQAARRIETEFEDALFDEAIDRQIAEIAA